MTWPRTRWRRRWAAKFAAWSAVRRRNGLRAGRQGRAAHSEAPPAARLCWRARPLLQQVGRHCLLLVSFSPPFPCRPPSLSPQPSKKGGKAGAGKKKAAPKGAWVGAATRTEDGDKFFAKAKVNSHRILPGSALLAQLCKRPGGVLACSVSEHSSASFSNPPSCTPC